MLFNLTFARSPDGKFYEFIFVGVLTGRPEEEVSEFQGDLLQELSKVHERARKASRFSSRKYGGAREFIQGSSAPIWAVEDIKMPRRCSGGMGHGKNTAHRT